MSDCPPSNKVIFPRKKLSDVEQRIHEKIQERKMNQGLAVPDVEGPEVELAEGKKPPVKTYIQAAMHST